jgi:hypothetical protein
MKQVNTMIARVTANCCWTDYSIDECVVVEGLVRRAKQRASEMSLTGAVYLRQGIKPRNPLVRWLP